MRIVLIMVALLFVQQAFASECVEAAKIMYPVMSAETETDFKAKRAAALEKHRADTKDADALIWYGRRVAYLGDYKKAIHIYTAGIKMHPNDARMYRHRGHRLISIRCFDDAIADFEKAAELVKGKPDEVEPDGLPNARNIPTSTLQSNIWYHLGLAHYLKGDFKSALKAYRNCLKVSKNPDMLVATTNWLYVTLRKLGKEKEARKMLEPITDDLDIIENDAYYKMLKLYKGKLKATDLLGSDGDALSSATMLYGVGNWALINGDREEAEKIFKRIVKGTQWSSFGYIAAAVELQRMDN